MEYSVFKVLGKWYQKRYLWSTYDYWLHPDDLIMYSYGYTWTRRGAIAEAELYMDKINDGRFI
jgi:hypothetical protein